MYQDPTLPPFISNTLHLQWTRSFDFTQPTDWTLPEVLPPFRLDGSRLPAQLAIETLTIRACATTFNAFLDNHGLALENESFIESLLRLFDPVHLRFINSNLGLALFPIDFLYTSSALLTWPRLRQIGTHYLVITTPLSEDPVDPSSLSREFVYELDSFQSPPRGLTSSLVLLSHMLFPKDPLPLFSLFATNFPSSVVIVVPSSSVGVDVSEGLKTRALKNYPADTVAERFKKITFTVAS